MIQKSNLSEYLIAQLTDMMHGYDAVYLYVQESSVSITARLSQLTKMQRGKRS